MKRPLILFYILVLYVLLQFSWWAYLLIELNDDVYQNKIELLENKHHDAIILEKENAHLEKDLHKSRQMVLGEGTVFLILLLIGIYITKHAFKREEELNRQQRNFLLSITHEFKSPLAAVKLNLQTIQKRQLEHNQQEDILRKAIMETERIETLVEKSLMATSFEDKNYEQENELLNLSDLVHRVVSDHVDRRDPKHNIIHHIAPSIYLKGDPIAFASLIVNLIENAEKYSPNGSVIEIRLTRSNQDALLTVSDQGIGIMKNERSKIFEKFYRIGNESTRKKQGTGLGLYLCRKIARDHNGDISVTNNEGGGSNFVVRF